MLLFRGGNWDRGLTKEELQQAMDKVMAWFEGLNERGRIKGAQPLGGQGRVISGTDGRFVVDGPFTETKEAVGGYLVLQADSLDEAVEIARSMPTLRYGISVEVRPEATALHDRFADGWGGRSSRSVPYSSVTRTWFGERQTERLSNFGLRRPRKRVETA